MMYLTTDTWREVRRSGLPGTLYVRMRGRYTLEGDEKWTDFGWIGRLKSKSNRLHGSNQSMDKTG